MAAAHARLFEAVAATGPGRADTLARLDALSRLLDSAILIPGTRQRVGLDALIGLVPGIGDLVSALLSSYIVWEARRLGLPGWKVARMVGNIALDTTIGAVPFVGDVLDVFFRANRRNLRILREHLDAEDRRTGRVLDGQYRVVGESR